MTSDETSILPWKHLVCVTSLNQFTHFFDNVACWVVMRLGTISHCFLLLYCTESLCFALTGRNYLPSPPQNCVSAPLSFFLKGKPGLLMCVCVCVNAPTILMVLSKTQGGWSDRPKLKVYKQAFLENHFISRKDAQTNGTAISLWWVARHTNFSVSPLTNGMKDWKLCRPRFFSGETLKKLCR